MRWEAARAFLPLGAGGMRAASARSRALDLLLTAVVALLVGLGGTWYALTAKRGIETVDIGPWRAIIEVTPRGTNPYVRALLARTGEMPMLATEAIVFIARTDSNGRPLRAACRYRLEGGWIDTRRWTLTVTDAEGLPLPETVAPRAVNSVGVLRDGEGRFVVTLAARARPGNWLSVEGGDRIALALRLYDSPLYVNGGLREAALPRIVAGECA